MTYYPLIRHSIDWVKGNAPPACEGNGSGPGPFFEDPFFEVILHSTWDELRESIIEYEFREWARVMSGIQVTNYFPFAAHPISKIQVGDEHDFVSMSLLYGKK
jgi:hypothetical protein